MSPNLTGVLGRKAGAADGFTCHSDALKQSGLVWDRRNLDAWLESPAALMPGNAMTFPSIANVRTRVDPVAYIETVSTERVKVPDRDLLNLKKSGMASRVTSVRFCSDTYRLTTADRKTHVFWEFNLRFKADGSTVGLAAGQPMLAGTSIQGDRTAVVFAHPEKISAFIQRRYP